MQPPTCKLCSVKHWPREPHQFSKRGEPLNGKKKSPAPIRVAVLHPEAKPRPKLDAKVAPVARKGRVARAAGKKASKGSRPSKTKQRWGRVSYNAYMRDYMAKRRAAGA